MENDLWQSYDFMSVFDWVCTEIDDSEDKNEKRRLQYLLKRYQHPDDTIYVRRKSKKTYKDDKNIGKYIQYMKDVTSKVYYPDLQKKLEKYIPKNEGEEKLVCCLKNGMQFLGDDVPSIFSFEYDPDEEFEPDVRPISLARTIQFVYTWDYLDRHMTSYYNSEEQETYCLTPHTTWPLYPTTTEAFFILISLIDLRYGIKHFLIFLTPILMNQLTNDMGDVFVPKCALIAYKLKGEYYHHDQYFLEMREIVKGKMTEGFPVTYEFMNELTRHYTESYSGIPHGSIPGNLLYCDIRKGSDKLIWYNPPQERYMHFDKQLHIDSAEYHVPGVVYFAGRGGLNIYAYKDKILTEDSKLYYGPFFNVTKGNVCLGSAHIELSDSPTYQDVLDAWEKMFWNSIFTHLGGSSNPTKNNLVSVTKKSLKTPFDHEELLFANKKLKELLK